MAILTDDIDIRKVFFNIIKKDQDYFIVLTEFPDKTCQSGRRDLKQICFKSEKELFHFYENFFKEIDKTNLNTLEEGSPNPEIIISNYGEREVYLSLEYGNNGDYYISIKEFDKKGDVEILSYRMCMSGGLLHQYIDARLSLARLYREREKFNLNIFPYKSNKN